MRGLVIFCALLSPLVCGKGACMAQTPAAQQPPAKTDEKPRPKVAPDVLKPYAGRYELEAGVIPISTLDVTLENGELWLKPSLIKKRKLVRTRKSVFVDEVEGKRYVFGKDEEGHVMSVTFEYEGASYTAQRVELPPPSLKGATSFRLKGYADASVVAVAGSFNNWNQSQILFAREGDGWVCRLDLKPGIYTYKFIIDGNWLLDPSNPDTAEDEAGNVNNVVEVRPSAP